VSNHLTPGRLVDLTAQRLKIAEALRCGVLRARALREAAGTLTGHAAEGADEGPRDVLTDVLAEFGGDARLQWGDVAARLASRFPARWEGVTADAISAECRARDVPSVDVKAAGVVRKGCRRGDVEPLAGAQ
jgi:S-DNA-T family DNA segregation ATPase FtsK/SpoIIIE